MKEEGATPEMLTEYELKALALTTELVGLVCGSVIGRGASREGDIAEFVGYIHAIQHMVASQAAARAYPDLFRLLGGTALG